MFFQRFFLLATFNSIYLVQITAKNLTSTGNINFINKFRAINITYYDESIFFGTLGYIQDDRIFLNMSLYREVYFYMKSIIRGQFQTKQRIMFNKTIDTCRISDYRKSKDLIFRMAVIPLFDISNFSYCPSQKVYKIHIFIAQTSFYSFSQLRVGSF